MLSWLHISSVSLLDIFLDQTCVGCQILPLLFQYVTLSLHRNNNCQYIWVIAIKYWHLSGLVLRSLCWFDGNFLSLQWDLLNMPAVAQLEKDEKYQLLYELLKIFLTKRLDSYLEFQTANSALLKDYGMFSCWTSTNDSSLPNSSISYILAAFLWFFLWIIDRTGSWGVHNQNAPHVFARSEQPLLWWNPLFSNHWITSGKLVF